MEDAARAPIDTLVDEQRFLDWGGHVKALYLRLGVREREHQKLRVGILHQIGIFEGLLSELCSKNARCRHMMEALKKDLEPLKTPPEAR